MFHNAKQMRNEKKETQICMFVAFFVAKKSNGQFVDCFVHRTMRTFSESTVRGVFFLDTIINIQKLFMSATNCVLICCIQAIITIASQIIIIIGKSKRKQKKCEEKKNSFEIQTNQFVLRIKIISPNLFIYTII